MDATLAWTVVGSAAGVVAVGVAAIEVVSQARSGRATEAKVTADMAFGQLARDGVLCVEFASGKKDVMAVSVPDEVRINLDRKPRKKIRLEPEVNPVNVIFIRNAGRVAVTIARCQYMSVLGTAEFRFEPQPAASPEGITFRNVWSLERKRCSFMTS